MEDQTDQGDTATLPPETSDSLPLVTFALLAYNQEKYIREAVEAALAQDYPNLEIIISDDGSQDETVKVAQVTIDSYPIERNALLRVTTSNLGPFRHVLDVASFARGDLIILAAGDDVSHTSRVSRIVKEWKRTSAWGFSSNYDIIDSVGNIVTPNTRTEELFLSTFDLRQYFIQRSGIGIVHGATSAYSAQLFRIMNREGAPWILSEDGAFSLVINFLNKDVIHINESLVKYRRHENALTNVRVDHKLTESQLTYFAHKAASYAASCRNRADFFLTFAKNNSSISTREVDYSFVRADIAKHEFRANWQEIGFIERLRHLRHHPEEWSWVIPRLFGLRTYLWIKRIRDRFSAGDH